MPADDTFPRLTVDNHGLTSEPDVGYNCIAWAVWDTERWWQPAFSGLNQHRNRVHNLASQVRLVCAVYTGKLCNFKACMRSIP
jgi:hypothetical protein